MIKQFYIPTEFVTSLTVIKEYPLEQRPEESSEDFLIRKLKSTGPAMRSTSSIDHPEFTKIREMLGDMGYISIERGWWNGDCVLKKFYLNDVLFRKGEKFYSAAAMSHHLVYELKRQTK